MTTQAERREHLQVLIRMQYECSAGASDPDLRGDIVRNIFAKEAAALTYAIELIKADIVRNEPKTEPDSD